MQIKIFKNKNSKNFESWPIWSCEVSEFNWTYQKEEHCFITEGEVTVIAENCSVNILKGDYVVFPKNLKCKWIVHSAIKKHFTFK